MADSTSNDFAPALLDKTVQQAVTIQSLSALKDIQNNGTTVDATPRSKLNFIAGPGITYTIADNSANDRVDVTINGPGAYRKTSSKTVNNTVADTDLLNGEITIAANPGVSALIRLTAWGDIINNSGALQGTPRWKAKFGTTTVLDTGSLAGTWSASASRFAWEAEVKIMNLGVANSQFVTIDLRYGLNGIGNAVSAFTTGNGVHVLNDPLSGLDIAAALGNNTAALDTTSSKLLEFSVILPTASVNIEAKLFGALVEVL